MNTPLTVQEEINALEAHEKKVGSLTFAQFVWLRDLRRAAESTLLEMIAKLQAENKALLVLVHGDWRDKPDQWTKEIEAAHPMETNQFKQYEKALEMVGNRNGKYELVDLVNWLLSRIAKLETK